jgi:hypothetical protein
MPGTTGNGARAKKSALVAREVLKSQAVADVTLVDFDPHVVDFARTALAHLNNNSLVDSRVTVQIQDAWDFVSAQRKKFHVIISDLTEPQSFAETRMHSVEWYAKLVNLLHRGGLIAVNMISPSAKPSVYWSMINTMQSVGLEVRPYRVAVPSFTREGYGPDWGFALASNQSITRSLITSSPLPSPRKNLVDSESLNRLFLFPSACAAQRLSAPLISCTDNDLTERIARQELHLQCDTNDWDALDWEPAQDQSQGDTLPYGAGYVFPEQFQRFFGDHKNFSPDTQWVATILAGEYGEQARQAIDRLLDSPRDFLRSIDLQALLSRLLARAAELPAVLVKELHFLKERLEDFQFCHFDNVAIGERTIAIISLIVIMANLASPDIAYGKSCGGGHGGGAHGGGAHSSGAHSSGVSHASCGHSAVHTGSVAGFAGGHFIMKQRRRAYGALGPTGLSDYYGNVSSSSFAGLKSGLPGQIFFAPGFSQFEIGGHLCTNRLGAVMPARRINCFPSALYSNYLGAKEFDYDNSSSYFSNAPASIFANYQLASDAYILPEGTVALMLGEKTALLVGQKVGTIIDTHDGRPLLQVALDDHDKRSLQEEIKSQILSIDQARHAANSWSQWKDSLGLNLDETKEPPQAENLKVIGTLLSHAQDSIGTDTKSVGTDSRSVESDTKSVGTDTRSVETGTKSVGIDTKSVETGTKTAETAPKDMLQEEQAGALMKIMPGVWASSDGTAAVIHLADGSIAYMTGKAWFNDAGKLDPCLRPYPRKFRDFLTTYLKHDLKNSNELFALRQEQLQELQDHLTNLLKEQDDYKTRASARHLALLVTDKESGDQNKQGQTVTNDKKDAGSGVASAKPVAALYGALEVPLEQAVALNASEVEATRAKINEINSSIASRGMQQEAMTKLLHLLRQR